MPNWCENSLYIEAPEEDIAAIKAAVAEQALLNYLRPEPEHLASSGGVMPTWYNWRVGNWGTKWEVNAEITGETENSLYIYFDSAWSPPIEALQHWIDQSEDRIVDLRYIEWGMAFCGIFNNNENDYYNIPETEAEVIAIIPEELNEQFDIVDTLAQWRDESELEPT